MESANLRSRNESSWDDLLPPSPLSQNPASGALTGNSLSSSARRQTGLNIPDSVIAAHCVIKGDLELRGRSQINGQIQGEISSEGELTIGEEADIKANIFGKVVIVFGRVEGHIKCTERLELHAGAHVTGDVLSPRVVIQDGVTFEGRCWMGEEQGQTQS